tara:strand:+ start:167 stop:319 length:153 start_codon:yes stop_codon:yes gene_type:complete
MIYYKCSFRAKFGAYAMNAFDLPTDNKKDITEILESDGYEVLEVYGIKEQ